MSQFIGFSMPHGEAGQLTRSYFGNVVESKKNDETTPVVAFGDPVKVNATKDGVSACSGASDGVYGISVRYFKQANVYTGTPTLEGEKLVSVLVSGYCAIQVAEGEPKFGDPVYLNASGKFTATATGGTAVPGAKFIGEKDANGVVEIAFNV